MSAKMQAALAALATLGVTVTLDGDCGRTELAATSPAPYNSATKCTKLKNIDNLESICNSSYYTAVAEPAAAVAAPAAAVARAEPAAARRGGPVPVVVQVPALQRRLLVDGSRRRLRDL